LRVLAKRFARPEFDHTAVAKDWSAFMEHKEQRSATAGAALDELAETKWRKPLLYYGVPTRGSPYTPTEYSDSEARYYQLLW
jgi:hypothetical protein